MTQKKNTRLIYIDEKNLQSYRTLKPEDFKEFMMAYLTYQPGDDMSSCFTNEYVYTLFLQYQDKIDYNESKWEKKANANRENGKKGGRPKKQEIEPNHDFENEAPIQPSNIETKPISEPIQSPIEESNIPIPEVVIKPQNEPFTDYQYTKLRDMADDYVRMVQQVNNGTLSKDAAWNQIYAGLDVIGISKDRAKEAAEYWYKLKFNAA